MPILKIAAQFFTLRSQRALSQTDLSSLSGVSVEDISKIESGDAEELTVAVLFRLAQSLDVSLDLSLRSFSNAVKDIAEGDMAEFEVQARCGGQ